jgi:predicted nucleotidyltransferase
VIPDAPSASACREALLCGDYAAAEAAVPESTAAVLRLRFLSGRVPDRRILDDLLLFRLRSMSEMDYRLLPDLSEGMENALRSASMTVHTRQELIDSLGGKRYPSSRISRLCACALLGLTSDQLSGAPLPENALLLGLRKNREMTSRWKDLPIPMIASFTEWKKAAHPADSAAWSLWAQCCRLPDTLPLTEQIITVE